MTGFLFRGLCGALLVAGVIVHTQAGRQGPDLGAALLRYEQQLAAGVLERLKAANTLNKAYLMADLQYRGVWLTKERNRGEWGNEFLSAGMRSDFRGLFAALDRGKADARRAQQAERDFNHSARLIQAAYDKVMAWPADRHVTADVRAALGLEGRGQQ